MTTVSLWYTQLGIVSNVCNQRRRKKPLQLMSQDNTVSYLNPDMCVRKGIHGPLHICMQMFKSRIELYLAKYKDV